MHEETALGTGVLDWSEGGGGPVANDPLDAVMAVAGPKGGAGLYQDDRRPERADEGGGLVVETKVTVDAQASSDGRNAQESDYHPFEWPEGFAVDKEAVAGFVPLAKKLGLKQEQAQELASLYAAIEQKRNTAQAEFVARNDAEWRHEIDNHPEFGGYRLRETGDRVAGLIRRFGSPTLVEQIRRMNVQNWPEMFFFLARVSNHLGEDSSPGGESYGNSNRSAAQILFPDFK